MTKVTPNDDSWEEYEEEMDALEDELADYWEDEYEDEDFCPGYIHQCGNPLAPGQQYCTDCSWDRQAEYDREHPPLPDLPLP